MPLDVDGITYRRIAAGDNIDDSGGSIVSYETPIQIRPQQPPVDVTKDELMDYRELLQKYIRHVGFHEGISFLRDIDRDASVLFTDEEWAELKRLDTPDSTETLTNP